MIVTPAERSRAVQRAGVLNLLTIGWNVVEGVVAVAAGVAASSASLIGFGLDSGIEVSAALILTWRLRQERHGGCQQEADDRAQRLVALCFGALAVYVGSAAVIDLVTADRPDESLIGIVIAALSLLVMPVLAHHKRRLAAMLGSRAAQAEAAQTDVCALLSAALLLGLAAHAVLGWWWADPIAALVIAGISALMAYRTATAEALADTCCT